MQAAPAAGPEPAAGCGGVNVPLVEGRPGVEMPVGVCARLDDGAEVIGDAEEGILTCGVDPPAPAPMPVY